MARVGARDHDAPVSSSSRSSFASNPALAPFGTTLA